jgi:hypothetical protein
MASENEKQLFLSNILQTTSQEQTVLTILLTEVASQLHSSKTAFHMNYCKKKMLFTNSYCIYI